MSGWLQLRPTFVIRLTCSPDEAVARMARERSRAGHDPLMLVHGEYGELHLPGERHRLWSPHLSFHVFERQGETVLLGRFAPRVNVWTVVWIFYLLLAFSAFFGVTIGWSQWSVGLHPWGWWLAGAAGLALAALYLVAQIGQQWSADQMRELRQKLEAFLERSSVLSAGLPCQELPTVRSGSPAA